MVEHRLRGGVLFPATKQDFPTKQGFDMAENRPSGSGFDKAFEDAKKQASGVAEEFSSAAQDIYEQTVKSSSRVASTAQKAARRSASSFENALRDTIENQPYTAVFI